MQPIPHWTVISPPPVHNYFIGRAREAESAARTTAAIARSIATRASVEETRRRREAKEANLRAAAAGRVAELEGRAELFRRRKKVPRNRAVRFVESRGVGV